MSKRKIKFGEWEDLLLWCPSQCFNYFKHEGKMYCIYLRWRHDNPWTADLVHIPKGVYDIADSNEWVRLDVPFFKDTELDGIKESSIKAVKKILETKNIK